MLSARDKKLIESVLRQHINNVKGQKIDDWLKDIAVQEIESVIAKLHNLTDTETIVSKMKKTSNKKYLERKTPIINNTEPSIQTYEASNKSSDSTSMTLVDNAIAHLPLNHIRKEHTLDGFRGILMAMGDEYVTTPILADRIKHLSPFRTYSNLVHNINNFLQSLMNWKIVTRRSFDGKGYEYSIIKDLCPLTEASIDCES